MNKIEADNTVIARRSLLDLADADAEENEKECYKVEKKRPIAIRPILTNSKFKSSRSLMSSP